MYFGGILSAPHVPRLVASSLLGRLPDGMAALALVLLVHHASGSFALSGVATAAVAGAAGCAAPFKGRWIDAHGQAGMLAASTALFSASFLALAAAAPVLPPWTLVALCALAGAGRSPLGSCMRAL